MNWAIDGQNSLAVPALLTKQFQSNETAGQWLAENRLWTGSREEVGLLTSKKPQCMFDRALFYVL